jgi:pimeloyl-ACP methyl ester carboxylesterase
VALDHLPPTLFEPAPAAGAPAAGAWETWLPWVLLGVVCFLAVVLLGFLSRYLRISLRLFLNTDMPLTAGLGSDAPLGGEVHEFPGRDGAKLKGVFIDPPAGTPVRGTVVFAHEFKADRNNAARYTAGLPARGLRVFAFDFRGHGQSAPGGGYHPTHWATNYEVNDLLAAVAYVEATASRPDHPVGILGVSRGACAAVVAALHTPKIRVLVVDGLFSTDLLVESLMRRWATIFASINLVRPDHPAVILTILRVFTILYAELTTRCRYPLVRKAISRLRDVPMLFIYGDGDAYIDKDQRLALYRIKPGLKQLWEVPGAKHNQAVVAAPQQYHERVAEFFEKQLPAAGREGAAGGQ